MRNGIEAIIVLFFPEFWIAVHVESSLIEGIPRRFVVKKLTGVRPETLYVPSQLRARQQLSETDEKRKFSATKLGICICEIFKLEISSLFSASFFGVHTTFVSVPILTVDSFLLILFLILLARLCTSLSQLKCCCCWSDKIFFTNSNVHD